MNRKSQWFLFFLLASTLFLLIGCFLPSPNPTPFVLQGRIMIPDSSSKDISGWIPFANASVNLTDSEGNTHTVITDSDGYYFFPELSPGENYIITATGQVDEKEIIIKDIIPLVEEGESYDAGTADCESTTLALVVEALLNQGLIPEEIDLEEIQNNSQFNGMVSAVCLALEAHEDVTSHPDIQDKITDIVDEIIPESEPSAPNPSSDATLSDLTVDGTTITGFSSTVLVYTQELPYDTTDIPTVDATTNDPDASKVITQASDLTGTETERTANVLVTAEDGVTKNTYNVTFTLLGPVHNITQGIHYDTIQEAFSAANTGDIIEASDGTYNESITFPSGKVIILQSKNGESTTIIQGANNSNTITCNGSLNGTILEGFTITHENPNTGRGIDNNGVLAINNCIISGNNNSISNYGGGIYNNGTLTINESTISGNSVIWCGGGIYNTAAGSLTINGSIISGNAAPTGYGGGIHNLGTVEISVESTISGNTVLNYGGGIYNQGTLAVDGGSMISMNTADCGGGVYNTGTFTLEGVSTINSNSVTSYGGGIYNHSGCMSTITGASMISDNSASGPGGGIYNKGTLNINGISVVSTNSSSGGGGIYQDTAESETTISSSIIYSNTAAFAGGGGIYQANGTLIVTSSTISSNELLYGGVGGGIYISAGSSTIGGNNDSDTGHFNTICGNSLPQISPDSYPNNYISDSCLTLSVGDSYGGGIVAYIFQIGDPGYVIGETHGLVAASADQSTGIVWHATNDGETGATGTALGTGNDNTNLIVTAYGTESNAAKICTDYTNTDTGTGVYSDWYLPSKDELNKLYINEATIGGFDVSGRPYWGSSECYAGGAWSQAFDDGTQYYGQSKNSINRVRAVRVF